MPDPARIEEFVRRWASSSGHERRHKDSFFGEMCRALGVDPPSPNDDDYCFDKDVKVVDRDGNSTTGYIDLYKRGCFVIEAKQGSEAGDAVVGTARRGTQGWIKAMQKAFVQARDYANSLEGNRPPYLITCDIGLVFEVWTGFSGNYGDYGARRTVEFADLAKPEVADEFALIFTDPWSLDPARRAQKVTREVAGHLAGLARSLEAEGHDAELVAAFLMRCLFTMFAEDVGLLPERVFTKNIEEAWLARPHEFAAGLERLWMSMNGGGYFGSATIRRFNGGLFASTRALPMTGEQLALLLEAAKCDWSSVEPAIFGTLVERALDAAERSRLGAHFTPREYIERLVRPAVIEPIRDEWALAQAEVYQILTERPAPEDVEKARAVLAALADQAADGQAASRATWEKEAAWARQVVARAEGEPVKEQKDRAVVVLRRFHSRLCHTRVLDPACGSGNFLYVTLDLFKQIEAEVLRELADLGVTQAGLGMEGDSVNPGQFLGIEVNARAREIADLVLWIGYLQWWRRTYGEKGGNPPDPVLREYRNIECRDAVLAWDGPYVPRKDKDGNTVTVWDMRSYKPHPVTGKRVPDEEKRATVYDYPGARPAEWPQADYVVSNPPFVGNKMMRQALGDGYAEALRATYPEVSQTADLVMYWWEKAARLAREGRINRFGLITTNSITQVFNRKVIERHLSAEDGPLALAWAIPDHPWVDAGADVRIAMTVGARADGLAGNAVLGRVTFEEKEQFKEPQARRVEIEYKAVPRIHADLSGGADVAGSTPLKANTGLSFQGMNLVGKGFRLTRDEVRALGHDPVHLPPAIRPYMNGRELTQTREDRYVIDLFGLTADEARDHYPSLYQRLLDTVKPERDQNKRDSRRRNWWLFGEPVGKLREAWQGLNRYILTPETSKHRFFVFAAEGLIPDHQLYAICSEEASVLGVLSSRFQVAWSLSEGAGATLEDRPRWRNNQCFDPFPFPDATDAQKARIRDLGECLDAHRKKVQAKHPDATLTGMYNALERLREIDVGGPALTEKERDFHERAQITVLKSFHDDLDAAVADAYGWPADLPDEEVLERLVALNRERAAEEARGVVRWLRPEFQNPEGTKQAAALRARTAVPVPKKAETPTTAPSGPLPWPKAVPDQLKAIRDLIPTRAGAWTAEDVAAAFKGRPKATVRRHLESLEALGHLVAFEDAAGRRWNVRAG
jgi:hypothetical protein